MEKDESSEWLLSYDLVLVLEPGLGMKYMMRENEKEKGTILIKGSV